MYLLDTNVLSELRRPRPHGGVVAWMGTIPTEQLKISAVTIGEIQIGIEGARRTDPMKAEAIEQWVSDIIKTYSVLPMSDREFRAWAKLVNRGSLTLFVDAMIAATALVHGLTIATRNTRDFKDFDVRVVDPFAHR